MNNRKTKEMMEEYDKEERIDLIKTEKLIAWLDSFLKERKYPRTKRRIDLAQRVIESLSTRDTLVHEDKICSMFWHYIKNNYDLESELEIINSCISGLLFCCPIEKIDYKVINKILSDNSSDIEIVWSLCHLMKVRFNFNLNKIEVKPDLIETCELLRNMVDACCHVLLLDRKYYKYAVWNSIIILSILSYFEKEPNFGFVEKLKNVDHDLSKMFVVSNLEKEIDFLKDKNIEYVNHLQKIVDDLRKTMRIKD